MTEMGLFGITVPEEYGGLDLDPVSFALVFEEIARGWMGIAGILGSHSLACRMIAMHGTEEQKQRTCPTSPPARGAPASASPSPTPAPTCRASAPPRGSTATTTSSTARRCGSPTPARRPAAGAGQDRPDATPAHKGMSVLLVDADARGFEVTKDIPKLGYKGTESCEIAARRRAGARGPNLLGGVEGRGMQQVLVRAGVGPGQHRRPLGRHRAARPRRGAGLRQAAQGVRQADRRLPGDPAQARPPWRPSSRPPG